MHKVIFKELEFRNFMSYGNTTNVFEFRDGLTWLSGDNGFGKSAIVEAMTFALLGISYRGGTKDELRNTKNVADGAPTTVVLRFDTDNPQDGLESWQVTRTISGKSSTIKFVIEKQVDGEWVAQNKRAGFSQQDFEDKVLNFNAVLFKNVIAMNTQETLPFFMLPAAKKRELLESIISLSLDSWKKSNHSRLSEASIKYNVAKSDYDQLTHEVDELEKIYTQMLSERSENLAQMKQEYDANVAQLNTFNVTYTELCEQKTALTDEINRIRSELAQEAEVDRRIEVINIKCADVHNLSSAKERLATATAVLAKFNQENAHKESEYVSLGNEHDELMASYNKRSQEISKLDTQCVIKQRDIEHLVNECNKITELAKSFVVGTPCPTCGHISDESDVERHKESLRKQWIDLNSQVKSMNSEYKTIVDQQAQLISDNKTAHERIDELDVLMDEYNEFRVNNLIPLRNEVELATKEVNRIEHSLIGTTKDALLDELEYMKQQKLKYPTLRAQYEQLSSEYSELSTKVGQCSGSIQQMNEQIRTLGETIERAENSNDDAIARMELKITKNKEMLDDAKNRMSDASDTISICNTITKVCADDGMKQMVFSMFVPAFNKAVQQNITKANLPFVVTFDNSMNYTFNTFPGLSPSYTMLSQGQKRKLGFAISMAFRDFVSLVGNFSVNFLSLDEVLDISTDDNSMRDMLDLAKIMLADIGCAVIITHRGKVVSDKFDFHQEVSNNGMYSMLGPIKPMWQKTSA